MKSVRRMGRVETIKSVRGQEQARDRLGAVEEEQTGQEVKERVHVSESAAETSGAVCPTKEGGEAMIRKPTPYLIRGELDNTIPGWVVGWMQFAGKEGPVTVKLKGDFDHGFGGGKIRFRGKATGKEASA